MGKRTSASKSWYCSSWPFMVTAAVFWPQHRMRALFALRSAGPEAGAEERCGIMLKEELVSTKNRRRLLWSVMKNNRPPVAGEDELGRTTFRPASFPARRRAPHTYKPYRHI
jgi:hypothetical protein